MKNYLKLLVFSVLVTLTFLLAPQKILSMNNPNQVDHHNVKRIVQQHLTDNPELLDSSKDKDIVVFLGNTGAGKSTLINYLSEKKLKVNNAFEIELDDPDDLSAMAIGGGSASQTFLPKFIQADALLLYDLPGFMDTRGTAENLVNACFIKRIIENAKSAKLVFVVGLDQITANRGDSFIKLSRRGA
ncbi:MAG: GTPase [Candidatus Paracaedibacter sp.]